MLWLAKLAYDCVGIAINVGYFRLFWAVNDEKIQYNKNLLRDRFITRPKRKSCNLKKKISLSFSLFVLFSLYTILFCDCFV